MAEERPCSRCGDFLNADRIAVPGIPFCRACVDREHKDRRKLAVHDPPGLAWQRLARVGLFIIGGLVLAFIGAANGLAPEAGAFGQPLTPLQRFGLTFVVGLFLGLLGVLTLGLSWIMNLGGEGWRRRLIAELELEEWTANPKLRIDLVWLVLVRPQLLRLRRPMEIGLLVSSDDGLLFFGDRGLRLALPLNAIAAVGTERIQTLPLRSALRLELSAEGRRTTGVGCGLIFAAFLDQPSFRANKAKAQEYAAAIKERLQLGGVRG